MSNKNLTILGIVAVLMVIWAVAQSHVSNRASTETEGPAYLLQGLDPADIDSIVLGGSEDTITLKRQQGSFVVVNKDNYPAKASEINNLITKVLEIQTSQFVTDKDTDIQRKAKDDLRKRLNALNDKLNGYLASTYGIRKYEDLGGNTRLFSSNDTLKQHTKEYKKWLESHQPFHWFAEFYEIINDNGGFDVVIGNPPYVEYSKIRKVYIQYTNVFNNLLIYYK